MLTLYCAGAVLEGDYTLVELIENAAYRPSPMQASLVYVQCSRPLYLVQPLMERAPSLQGHEHIPQGGEHGNVGRHRVDPMDKVRGSACRRHRSAEAMGLPQSTIV